MYIKMPPVLKDEYKKEIFRYQENLKNKDLMNAWKHLERSHVLGQAYPVEHTYAHWLMLKFGFKIKDTREILGQLPRLLFGGIKSFVGVIPVGNTGGSNVPALKPMPIPSDLMAILDNSKTPTHGRS